MPRPGLCLIMHLFVCPGPKPGYLLGGGAAAAIGLGGGGGGGCSVSAGGEGNMVEFALPYIGLVVVMAILKVRDARERKARST